MDAHPYSAGPFSRVMFVYTRDGLSTYTYRVARQAPAGSLINTTTSLYDGGPRFNDVFVATDLLPAI